MKEALGASDFSLSELKTGLCTVYLVLPPQYLGEHGRFLRLFVNLALLEASKGQKPRYPILMVLDEFYALGRLQFMATAAGLLAGYGVKLWPIVQNLGQIAELYPDNWETFLGNAGMWQVFAVNDQTTARYMSERLGEHIVWRKQRTFNQETQKYEEEWMPQGASFLRTGIELGREVSRDSGNQVIFVEGGDCFLLRRRPYDKTFKRTSIRPIRPNRSGGFEDRMDAAKQRPTGRLTNGTGSGGNRRQVRETRRMVGTAAAGGKKMPLPAKAQAPAPVPQPVVKADLKAMSPEELQAEKEKIFLDIGDGETQKHHLQRFMEIEKVIEERAAAEQAVRA